MEWTSFEDVTRRTMAHSDSPIWRIDYNGPWINQVRGDERTSMAAIKLGHFNSIKPRVCPVNVPSHPVNRNPCMNCQM